MDFFFFGRGTTGERCNFIFIENISVEEQFLKKKNKKERSSSPISNFRNGNIEVLKIRDALTSTN